ncbi:MAG: hypothetical protein LT106_18710 [Burkholderiaceae bacterium]|nr:hypothetical protein [Burkholderiaceae bacterium]
MATIENSAVDIAAQLRDLDDQQLIAQELVQQGAVHAVSFLLAHGCTKAVAEDMLESLRGNAAAIRAEIGRRGESPLFKSDQIAGDTPAEAAP